MTDMFDLRTLATAVFMSIALLTGYAQHHLRNRLVTIAHQVTGQTLIHHRKPQIEGTPK
jgi:hypothetical protein